MRLFSKDHEWIEIDGDVGTVGITRHAAETLGEIVFLEIKPAGTKLSVGDAAAVVESVKAASDIYVPVSGEISDVNGKAAEEPGLLNSSPETEGWLFRIRLANAGETANLMDGAAYKAFCAD